MTEMDIIQTKFEQWAVEHQFKLEWDDALGIYQNPYTQGAWMAYQQGRLDEEWNILIFRIFMIRLLSCKFCQSMLINLKGKQ